MNGTTTPGDDELSTTDELDDDSVQAGSKRKRKASNKANGASRRRSGRASIKQPPDDTSLDKQPHRRSSRRNAAGGLEGEGSDTRATKRLRRGSVGSTAAVSISVAADPTAALSSLSINGAATTGPKTSVLKPGERVIDIAGKKKSKVCPTFHTQSNTHLTTLALHRSFGSTLLKAVQRHRPNQILRCKQELRQLH